MFCCCQDRCLQNRQHLDALGDLLFAACRSLSSRFVAMRRGLTTMDGNGWLLESEVISSSESDLINRGLKHVHLSWQNKS